MTRLKTLTKNEAIKSVRITEDLHTAIRRIAVDSKANMIEATNEVVMEGVRAVREKHSQSASPN